MFAYSDRVPSENENLESLLTDALKIGFRHLVLIKPVLNNYSNKLPSNVKEINLSFRNLILPNVVTFYYNQVFKLPDLPRKKHVVKVNKISKCVEL